MSQALVYENFNTWELQAPMQSLFATFFKMNVMVFQETQINQNLEVQ